MEVTGSIDAKLINGAAKALMELPQIIHLGNLSTATAHTKDFPEAREALKTLHVSSPEDFMKVQST